MVPGINTEASVLEKACVKTGDCFCQDVEFSFVCVCVEEVGFLDCLDKTFTEVKNTGLGMMWLMANLSVTFSVALGKLFNLSDLQFVHL